jgi:hypothetical protein
VDRVVSVRGTIWTFFLSAVNPIKTALLTVLETRIAFIKIFHVQAMRKKFIILGKSHFVFRVMKTLVLIIGDSMFYVLPGPVLMVALALLPAVRMMVKLVVKA